MSTADNILDQIDGALGDYAVSGDAMRWTPDPPPAAMRSIVIHADTTALRERLGAVQESLRRMAEAFQPVGEAAADCLANMATAMRQPARPIGRPVWQSPYGPAQRRR